MDSIKKSTHGGRRPNSGRKKTGKKPAKYIKIDAEAFKKIKKIKTGEKFKSWTAFLVDKLSIS